MTINKHIYNSPVGKIYIYATDNGVINVSFKSLHNNATTNKNKHINDTIDYFDNYFKGVDGKKPKLDIKLSDTLKSINKLKFGQTAYYSDLMGNNYARAIGNGCKNNPILIIIPCHRVIAKSGKISYIGGANIKKWLLNHEKAIK